MKFNDTLTIIRKFKHSPPALVVVKYIRKETDNTFLYRLECSDTVFIGWFEDIILIGEKEYK